MDYVLPLQNLDFKDFISLKKLNQLIIFIKMKLQFVYILLSTLQQISTSLLTLPNIFQLNL
jgi:hypothetical protein